MSTKTAFKSKSKITLLPFPDGREYTSKAQAQADWDADKDFTLADWTTRNNWADWLQTTQYDGKPINRSQIESHPHIKYVEIRSRGLRGKVHVIKVGSTKTARSLNLTYHTDPGHGWLEVPMSLLKELGIAGEITSYSMRKGQNAYLEEDLDMGTFLRAAEEAGWNVRYTERYKENTPLRNYPGYRRASDRSDGLRSAALKRASKLPVGHPTRKKILAVLDEKTTRVAAPMGPRDIAKFERELEMMEAEHDSLMREIESLG